METNEHRYQRLRWENDPAFRRWVWTLVHNLAVAGFGATMFRAGDNHGFHMGADEMQCTCQWSPGYGDPYKGATRCEQDEFYEDDFDRTCDRYDDGDYYVDDIPVAGPNGCVCGSNGDCNCPFVA